MVKRHKEGKATKVVRGCQDGSKNHAWKGGHKYWCSGKLGRDKDGLSWKVQRKLAWERDNYTCQDCNKHKPGWKPDVHHIKPYRLSFSHALLNLKCLCRRCHKKAEALIKELWGGKVLTPPNNSRTRGLSRETPPCQGGDSGCKSRRVRQI